MKLIRYETWKDHTSVTGKIRSRELKAVDTALENYEKVPTDKRLNDLRLAWEVWKALHPDWQHNRRNRMGVLVVFNRQLYEEGNGFKNIATLADFAELPFCGIEAVAAKASLEGFNLMKAARQESLNTLLAGKKLVFKPTGLSQIKDGIKSAVAGIRNSAKREKKAKAAAQPKNVEFKFEDLDMVGTIGGALQEFPSVGNLSDSRVKDFLMQCVNEILGDLLNEFVNEVVNEVLDILISLMPSFIGEFAAAMAPYVSVGISGAKTLNHLAKATKAQYRMLKTEDHKEAFRPGDPEAAVKAVKRILKRERNFRLANASIYATDTALKSVGIAADAASFGAPSVSLIITASSGAATALADLSLRIYQIARDVHEKYEANKILANTTVQLSGDIFETCPVLGCYYIACANTSDVLNFLIEDMVDVGWQLNVETMVKNHITPMIGYAREIIANSRLAVEGLESSKGVVTDTSHGIEKYKKMSKDRLCNKVKGLRPRTSGGP